MKIIELDKDSRYANETNYIKKDIMRNLDWIMGIIIMEPYNQIKDGEEK